MDISEVEGVLMEDIGGGSGCVAGWSGGASGGGSWGLGC